MFALMLAVVLIVAALLCLKMLLSRWVGVCSGAYSKVNQFFVYHIF